MKKNVELKLVRLRMLIVLISIVIGVKAILATLSTIPFDFVNIARTACFTSTQLTYYGAYTPSIYFMNLFYRLWLILPMEHPSIDLFWYDKIFIPSPSAFTLIFLFKLPLIAADILTGLVIYLIVKRLGGSKNNAIFAFTIWLLNPYVLFTVQLDGKIDILTVFLVTLSLYLFIRNKLTASAITLALGIVFRFYPIILIPLYLLFLPSRKIKSMIAFLSPIILFLGSGALVLQKLTGSGFIENVSALILSGNKEFLWFFGHTFTSLTFPNVAISSVVIGYVLIIIAFYKLRQAGSGVETLIDACLGVLLIYVMLSHWNAGYPFWVFPFLTVNLAYKYRGKKMMYLLYALITASILLYITTIWDIFPTVYMPSYTVQIEALSSFAKSLHLFLYPGRLVTTFAKSVLLSASSLYVLHVLITNFRQVAAKNRI